MDNPVIDKRTQELSMVFCLKLAFQILPQKEGGGLVEDGDVNEDDNVGLNEYEVKWKKMLHTR